LHVDDIKLSDFLLSDFLPV